MKAFEKTKAGPKLQKLKFRNHEFFYLPVIFLCKGRTIFEPTWARSPLEASGLKGFRGPGLCREGAPLQKVVLDVLAPSKKTILEEIRVF